MNAVSLDRLLGYGPLLSVTYRWDAYDHEDPAYADRDGVWRVWGVTAVGEEWLGTADEEPEAKAFAEQVGLYLGVPLTTKTV